MEVLVEVYTTSYSLIIQRYALLEPVSRQIPNTFLDIPKEAWGTRHAHAGLLHEAKL